MGLAPLQFLNLRPPQQTGTWVRRLLSREMRSRFCWPRVCICSCNSWTVSTFLFLVFLAALLQPGDGIHFYSYSYPYSCYPARVQLKFWQESCRCVAQGDVCWDPTYETSMCLHPSIPSETIPIVTDTRNERPLESRRRVHQVLPI